MFPEELNDQVERYAELHAKTRLDSDALDLAEALNQRAAAYEERKDREAAQADLDKAIVLYRDVLSSRDRGDYLAQDLLENLANALDDRSSVLKERGLTADAVRNCEEAIELSTGLMEEEARTYSGPDLVNLHSRCGFWLIDLARFEEAMKHLDRAISLWRQSEREEIVDLRLLGAIHQQRATALEELGKLEPAKQDRNRQIEVYDRAIEILRKRQDPETLADFLLSRSLVLSGGDRLSEALRDLDESVGLQTELVRARPNVSLDERLVESFHFRGEVLRSQENHALAAEDFKRAVEILEKLVKELGRLNVAEKLVNSLYCLGDELGDLGKAREAIESYSRAIALCDELGEANFDEDDLPDILCRRGDEFSDAGSTDEAAEDYGRAVRIYTALSEKEQTEYLPSLARALRCRGGVRMEQDRFQEAASDFRGSSEAYRRLIADHGEDLDEELASVLKEYAEALNELAWFEATCRSAEHRDGPRAIEHARQACELARFEDAVYLDTLAAAYAEAGDFENALHWEARAVELADPEDRAKFADRLRLYGTGKPHSSD